jgi:pyruvate,water dikinase
VILRLGSGEVARKGCGSKAALLDQAARAGLPVPPGVVIHDDAWRWAVERGLVRVEAPTDRRPVSVPDPSLLVHLLRLPEFPGPLAVRAAFSGEDDAGGHVPGLFVDSRRPAALAAGLAGVWASAIGHPRGFRRDLILQEMVRARSAGVALTERDYEDDLVEVNATNGPAEILLGGTTRGERLPLPKRRGRERPTEPDPVQARLQVLLRDLRRGFGEGDWEVEWADDGERIWIIQIHPLIRPVRRDDVFTATAHGELALDPPSRLMTSLINACEPGLLELLRRFDPGLPAGRPLVQVFLGRPFLNLSFLIEMMRRWGLPSCLVTDSLGGTVGRDFQTQPGRLLRHPLLLIRLGRAQLCSARSAGQAEQRILERTASSPSGLVAVAEELVWLYRTLATETLSLTAALCGPLALLRRAGVLAEVTARWRAEGRAFLDDIPLLRAPAGSSNGGSASQSLSVRARLLRPVAWQAEQTLRAREQLCNAASRGIERLEEALLSHARSLVSKGLLPSVEALFQLELGELGRIGKHPRPAAFWRVRKSETDSTQVHDYLAAFRPPDGLQSLRR